MRIGFPPTLTSLFFVLAIALPACSDPSVAPAAPPRNAELKEAIESRLMGELRPATDRAGRERNAIVNRAIDQLYDLRAAPEGYFYEILEPGEYTTLTPGDIVEVHYRGNFLDGTEFDNSRQRGKRLRFYVGGLIEAWNLGLQRVKPGGAIRILTPSSLAYGADGLTGARGDTLVPAHTVLEFVIDDIEVFEPEE